MYQMVKSLNNNLVLVVDEHQEELILFGKGVGFKRKKGDIIDSQAVSKIFQTKGEQQSPAILETVSPEILSLTGKIIQFGEAFLEHKLNSTILFSLADHLQNAIQRTQENVMLAENTLHWEIKFLYLKEFELGKKVLEMVQEELSIDLPETEASLIALHFVNAQDEYSS